MTVTELIKKLENCNPEAEVYISTGDINLMVIEVEQEAPAMVVIS